MQYANSFSCLTAYPGAYGAFAPVNGGKDPRISPQLRKPNVEHPCRHDPEPLCCHPSSESRSNCNVGTTTRASLRDSPLHLITPLQDHPPTPAVERPCNSPHV